MSSLREHIEAAKSAADARSIALRRLQREGALTLSGRLHRCDSGLDRATVAVIATAWWVERQTVNRYSVSGERRPTQECCRPATGNPGRTAD